MTTNGRSAAGARPCGPSATPSTARPLPALKSERAVATGCAAVAAVHGSGVRGRGSRAVRPASRTGNGRRGGPRAAPFGGRRVAVQDAGASRASPACIAASPE
eukprot:5144452-Prymnesium_polylepis.1